MIYKIDIKRISDGMIHIQGWVLPENPNSQVSFDVTNENNEHIEFKLVRLKREDVSEVYLKGFNGDKNFGFDIEFNYEENDLSTYYLIIKTKEKKVTEKINKRIIDSFNTNDRKKKELFFAYFNRNTFKRAFDFLLKEGPKEFFKKTKRKIKGLNVDYDYSEWYELTKPKENEINELRGTNSQGDIKFSIVIPIYDTSDEFLYLLFESILCQTYTNFEVCIVDATNYNNCKNNPKKFFEKLLDKNNPLKIYMTMMLLRLNI